MRRRFWSAGEKAIVRLLERIGAQQLLDIGAALHSCSDSLVRNAVATMPDGRYDAGAWSGGLGETGGPIRFRLVVTISGYEVETD